MNEHRTYTTAQLRAYHPELTRPSSRRVKATKAEVLASFREEVLPAIIRQYGRDDHIAIREAWNNYTDSLCKDGQITHKQYDTWTNPF